MKGRTFHYIRYDSVYLTCSKKLTDSQLSLPHGMNSDDVFISYSAFWGFVFVTPGDIFTLKWCSVLLLLQTKFELFWVIHTRFISSDGTQRWREKWIFWRFDLSTWKLVCESRGRGNLVVKYMIFLQLSLWQALDKQTDWQCANRCIIKLKH